MERIVVCDIDGVVCLMDDQPRPSVSTILRELQRHMPLVFVTFRHHDRYLDTMNWLQAQQFNVRNLIMRGRSARPLTFKRETLEWLMLDFEIGLFFEDDPDVCRMARELAVPTVYVPYGEQ